MKVREALELEMELREAAKRPAYRLPPNIIDDWTGDKYTSTHRCFGKPCDPDALKEGKFIPLKEGESFA
jgi:hypothetical protein